MSDMSLIKNEKKMRKQTKKVPTALGVIRLRTRGLVMFNGKDDHSNIKGNKRSPTPHSSQWNLLWHPLYPYSTQIQSTDTHKNKIKIRNIKSQPQQYKGQQEVRPTLLTMEFALASSLFLWHANTEYKYTQIHINTKYKHKMTTTAI